MGYVTHHVITVTSWSLEKIAVAHDKARQVFDVSLVSATHLSLTNGYCSFAIFPDGSKDGWDMSDDGDERRAEYVSWLLSTIDEDGGCSFAWAEVEYGESGGRHSEARIVPLSEGEGTQS